MSEKVPKILVIGAGVSGLQTAKDLTERGYFVYLVEKEANLGGKIMQLDETFPVAAVSQSCSLCYPLCYMLPELSKLYLDKNISIYTYSEVSEIKDNKGVYEVIIKKKQRFVDPSKCNGCGLCTGVCPVKDVSDEFNFNLSKRTAIYQPMPGSITPQYIIDDKTCLHFINGKCNECAKVCPYSAIDYEQKEEKIKVDVNYIVIATGFDQIDPKILPQYGSNYKNIVTSLQFERLNSINGPTSGKVLRLSDGKEPKSIAFVQCVGSRTNNKNGCVSYCSTVCCMYSSKEALNIRKKKIPNCECYIFNTEKRGYGKEYYDMFLDAEQNWGVKYINGRVASIVETKNNNLLLKFEDINTGQFISKEFEMVVLAGALVKTKGKSRIAQLVGSTLDENGLFSSQELEKLEKKNIFIGGFARFPMNIPDSIIDGSAIASKIAKKSPISLLNWEPPLTSTEEQKEIITQIEPRIGIFYCDFNDKILNILNFELIKKEISSINVVVVQETVKNAYMSEGKKYIQDLIVSNRLSHVLFISGSPRYYEDFFKILLNEINFNIGMMEIVDLREQNTYVHGADRDAAHSKSIDVIKYYISKLKTHKPITIIKDKINQSVLIVGSDISSIIAADSIAKQSIKVHLVQPDEVQNVDLNKIIHSSQIPINDLKDLINNYQKNQLIKIYPQYNIIGLSGYAGNFDIILEDKNKNQTTVKVGSIILSGGAEQAPPSIGQFKYGINPIVMTQQEFELTLSQKKIEHISKIAIILCVNQRINLDSEYVAKIKSLSEQEVAITSNCSNICCSRAFHNIKSLLQLNPNAEINVLYRDLQLTGGNLEEVYRDLKKNCVFLRYDSLDAIETNVIQEFEKEKKGRIHLSFFEQNTNSKVGIEADLVILATPMTLNKGTQDLIKLFKLRTEKFGFLQEEHSKVLPLNSTRKGIFISGNSQWPNDLDLLVSQGLGVAMKAANFLAKGYIESLPQVAEISSKCMGCGTCLKLCPYKAITFDIKIKHYVFGDREVRTAKVNPLICQSCGICVSECPVNAITILNSNDGAFSTLISTFLSRNQEAN